MTEEATQDGKTKAILSFWSTLPGVLTAAATFITAVSGLLLYFHNPPDETHPITEPVVTTSPTRPPDSNPTTTSAPSSTTTVSTSPPITIPAVPTPSTSSSSSTTKPPSAGCTVFDTMNRTFITVSPERAPKGAQVKVTGRGFCPGDPIAFKVHTSNAGNVTTDGNGGFVTTVTVPEDAPPSGFSTDISANSRTNRGRASAPFTMG